MPPRRDAHKPNLYAVVLMLLAPLLVLPGLAGALGPASAPPNILRLALPLGSHLGDEVSPVPAHTNVPESATGIGPGAGLLIARPDGKFECAAGFVFEGLESQAGQLYLGTAGQCLVPTAKTATHGLGADYAATSTSVIVCISNCVHYPPPLGLHGTFAQLGPVAYARRTGAGGEIGNDFGVVEIPSELSALVRSRMPTWHGPTIHSETVTLGSIVCHHARDTPRSGDGVSATSTHWRAITTAPVHELTGEAGAAANVCATHPGGGGVHGRGSAGIVTHVDAGAGVVIGTTTPRAIYMASSEAGLTLGVRLDP